MMTEWFGRTSQGHEIYCHDLEVMGLNSVEVNLGSVCVALLSQVVLELKISLVSALSVTSTKNEPPQPIFYVSLKVSCYICPV